ncbi:MAG: YggU family protein [Deltaproteobacteria bacterium]|nr:YggU family protein [Deltaproteobacteria bacterium]
MREVPGGVEIDLWVQPRASKTSVVGPQGDAIKVRVAAPPVDGKANAELVRFLAKRLGVPRSAVEVVRGETGRRKTVRIAGLTPAEARTRLGAPPR